MKAGRGLEKGGEFERKTNKKLSLWISRGERADIFRRNAGSGGAFSNAARRGVTSGLPGDTAGAFELAFDFPLATAFLKCFMIECKHWKDLNLDQALWKRGGEFYRIVKKAQLQASTASRQPMIIARQNYRPTLLLLPYRIGIMSYGRLLPDLIYHGLWRNLIFACCFEDALKIDPLRFMHLVQRELGKEIENASEIPKAITG